MALKQIETSDFNGARELVDRYLPEDVVPGFFEPWQIVRVAGVMKSVLGNSAFLPDARATLARSAGAEEVGALLVAQTFTQSPASAA